MVLGLCLASAARPVVWSLVGRDLRKSLFDLERNAVQLQHYHQLLGNDNTIFYIFKLY